MIAFIIISFVLFSIGLAILFSYELREKIVSAAKSIIPHSKQKLSQVGKFAKEFNDAASIEQTQTHWHLQQWWILIAGLAVLLSILSFAFTRPIDPTKIEADFLRKQDPQIYALLNGEVLTPPPEVDESLIQEAIVDAMVLEQAQPSVSNPFGSTPSTGIPEQNISADLHGHYDTVKVDRKWDNMHPRYKQRLLMVFKIMKEQHGYEMVLLEGYRSPERQNRLSGNKATTLAKAYQSYHQFGLAADVAFKRNGKVVISERDPWAWQGYQLYGQTAESVGLTWGGRWTRIHDYGHTEYRMPGLKKNRESAERLIAEAQNQGLMANNISVQ